LSVYPATTGAETWIRFDNASLFRAPTQAPFGTECVEPVPTPPTSWSPAATYPITVLDNAVTSVGGNLYSFGGVSTTVTGNAYRFDGASWTPIASLPAPLEYASAVTDGTDIYIVSGALNTGVPQTTLYRYNVAANNYTPLASSTTGTWNQAAVFLNGRIYKFGGTGAGSASTNVLEIYDVASNTWSPGAAYPLAASFISAFAHGNFVYAAGGFQSALGAATNKTYRYDPVSNTWDDVAIADLPATRWGAAHGLFNGGGLVAGGYVGGSATANISTSVLSWHSGSNSWLTFTSMAGERSRVNGAILGSSFYVIGGRSIASSAFVGTNDNQKLSLVAGAFEPQPDVIIGDADPAGSAGDALSAAALTPAPAPAPAFGGGAGGASSSSTSGVVGIVAVEGGSRTLWQRTLDLSTANDVSLRLESWLRADESTAWIEVSVDGRTWSSIGVLVPAEEWTSIDVDLAAYSGQIVHVRMRFDGVQPRFGMAPDFWGIRNVVVTRR
jgi:N-acetylneuraminic acid mutarotase